MWPTRRLLSVQLLLLATLFLCPASFAQPVETATPTVSPEEIFRTELLELINEERAKEELTSLTPSCALDCIALWHSQDMLAENYFAHESLDGRQPWDRFRRATSKEIRWYSENLAGGQLTAKEVTDAWMKSKGHRKNMLHERAVYAGIGVVRGNAKHKIKQGWIVTLNLSATDVPLTKASAKSCPCAEDENL